jgi:hypothetical protein
MVGHEMQTDIGLLSNGRTGIRFSLNSSDIITAFIEVDIIIRITRITHVDRG